MFLTGRVVSAKERKTQKGQREVVLQDKGYFSVILKDGFSVEPGAFPHNAA